MKKLNTLIVEDDYTSQVLLRKLLQGYGSTHVVVDGKEAVLAIKDALSAGTPYNLICLDIMMPNMDGQETLRIIRKEEKIAGLIESNRAKVVMTTAFSDKNNVVMAIKNQCNAFLVKPITKDRLLGELRNMALID
jgi:two-component system, chemotaxis family, chemotaxis protein CheY